MQISYRHSKGIKKRVLQQGIIGVKRKPGSGRKGISDELKQKIVLLYNKKYNDPWHPFNISHFQEKLSEVHSINLSYETIRKIINITLNRKKRKYKKKHRKQRPRMPEKGLLLQMDTSFHQWIKNIPYSIPFIF